MIQHERAVNFLFPHRFGPGGVKLSSTTAEVAELSPLRLDRAPVQSGIVVEEMAEPVDDDTASDDVEQRVWDAVAVGSPAQEAPWLASVARFTARWNAILEELGIATRELEGLTPGSMRGGGATALFEAFEDADHVRRRVRVTKTATAESYIQEVGGQRCFASLPDPTGARVLGLARHSTRLLVESVEMLVGGSPAAFHPRDLQAARRRRHAPVRRRSRERVFETTEARRNHRGKGSEVGVATSRISPQRAAAWAASVTTPSTRR